jgi:alkylated DNA repair dioxygenase AlkB
MSNDQPPIVFKEGFIADADALYETILTQTPWDGRMHARLTASYGVPYNYANMSYPAVPMPEYLQQVCAAIHQRIGFLPNNCLINNYVEGSSSMGFHADSITELVPGTGVAIISLGEMRTLTFRRTAQREIRWDCPLPHGSLCYMPPAMQLEWQHGVLKQAGAGQRVSLTFRALQS